MAENITIREEIANEIISWCKATAKMNGGKVRDVFKEIHNDKGGLDSKSFKRWHFEKSGNIFGVYAYCYVDIQAILLDNYVATIEVGVKREGQEDMKYPVILRMYDTIRGVNDLRRLMRVGYDIAKTGETIIRRQELLDD